MVRDGRRTTERGRDTRETERRKNAPTERKSHKGRTRIAHINDNAGCRWNWWGVASVFLTRPPLQTTTHPRETLSSSKGGDFSSVASPSHLDAEGGGATLHEGYCCGYQRSPPTTELIERRLYCRRCFSFLSVIHARVDLSRQRDPDRRGTKVADGFPRFFPEPRNHERVVS